MSEGARSFATLHAPSIQTVFPESLKSARAEAEWKKWKNRIETSSSTGIHVGEDSLKAMQDTVGAVSWHPEGGMAAGVSRLVIIPGMEPLLICALEVVVSCSNIQDGSVR